MITKERLEELIKQEAIIYGIIDNDAILEIDTKDLSHPKQFGNGKELKDILACCYDAGDGINIFEIDYFNIYETKKEAEFIAKNHDTRIEKFEPPFELKEDGEYRFNSKNCYQSKIYRCNVDSLRIYAVENNSTYVTKYFHTYQEAVNYAHKLFKGEAL